MAEPSTEQFVRLFVTHEQELYSYAFSLMANREDAKDVTQEAAVTMWQQFSEYDPSRPFRPWALRYIYFTALKLRKRSRGNRYKISDEAVAALAEAVAADTDDSPTLTQRRLEALGECIDKLPAPARRLMSLRYRQGLSIQEIARRGGRNLNSLYKSFEKMRAALQQCVDAALFEQGAT
jgi:RNA polymerase sigma-70 factor (ECF subfamily)